MRSALIFVLVVAALAKYDVTGNFKVIECDCDQTKASTVTDFYVGRKVNFKSTDITKWPYNVAADFEQAGTAKLDMDRVYVFARVEGEINPHTELFLNTPDCTKMTKDDCPAECVADDTTCSNKPACHQLTQEECKSRKDDCVWNEKGDDSICAVIDHPCDYYKDVYSCVTYKSDDCEWKDNTCVPQGAKPNPEPDPEPEPEPEPEPNPEPEPEPNPNPTRSSRSARDNKNTHSYVCFWKSDDQARCTRILPNNENCSITLEHSGSTKTVIATLTVVVIAVIAVLF